MHRRKFLAHLGAGAATLTTLTINSSRILAQDYSKDYPLHCVPPQPAGTPKQLPATARPLMPRKSVFDLSSAEVQKLRDAYAALRDLSTKDPHDPRGWRHQANVHCYYCSGGYDALGTEIHGSWWFLPWHRCYLYMHERILGALLGDASFRLPYWDWDTIPDDASKPHRTVPPVYDAASYQVTQPAALSIANPLFDRARGATSANVIPSLFVGKTHMKQVMCQTGAQFLGAPDQAGQLEQNPHGPVHIWSGDPRPDPTSQPAPFGCYYPANYPFDPKDPTSFPVDESQVIGCTDMGVLATAAQDPIFYAHHANIDRLWSIWLQIPGHVNPTDLSWLNTGWAFYDENKNWVFITVQQVLDAEQSLGYVYQPPQVTGYTTTPAICPPPAPSPVATLALAQATASLTIAESEPGITVGTKPHTQTVALPAEQRSGLQQLAAGRAQKSYVLHIDGISMPPNGGVIVRVLLDLPEATAKTDADAPQSVGIISVVPSGPGHKHRMSRNVAFDLSPELAGIIASQDKLSVTLVPVTAGGGEPLQGTMSYKKIYLTVK